MWASGPFNKNLIKEDQEKEDEKASKKHLKSVHGTHSGFKHSFGGHASSDGYGSSRWEKPVGNNNHGKKHAEMVKKAIAAGYKQTDEKHSGTGGIVKTYKHSSGKTMTAGTTFTSSGKGEYFIHHGR